MKCLLLSIRGLRPDCLGCYGNDWIDTPHLDRLAAESVVFDQHFAAAPDEVSACRAWCGEGNVLRLLSAAGVETAYVGDGDHPPPEFFSVEFQKARFVETGARVKSIFAAAKKAVASLAKREHALLWIDVSALLPPWQVSDEFLELYFPRDSETEEGCLTPWTGPLPAVANPDDEELLLRLRRTYAAVLSQLDAHLGVFLDSLREIAGEWMVLFTAPYGLPLGEHGIAGTHRPWLHDELVHLPLLVRFPNGAEAGRRVLGLTQSSDLAATVLEQFNLPFPEMAGRSLLPICRGETESIRAEVVSSLHSADAEEWALRTTEWAFLLPTRTHPDDPPRSPQMYVKPEDRFEVNNVIQHHMDLAEEMERRLRDRMAEIILQRSVSPLPVLRERGRG
jgi:arylsulfatase A-like enzyme